MFSPLAHRALILISYVPAILVAAVPDGASIYKDRCSLCHDKSAETRAPAPAALRRMSPENIVAALESGLMKDQGAALSVAERRAVAGFLTGRTVGQESQSAKPLNVCPDKAASFSLSGADWNGWGVDLANTRFQNTSGLTAAQVPRLKLKWAFAFPNTF